MHFWSFDGSRRLRRFRASRAFRVAERDSGNTKECIRDTAIVKLFRRLILLSFAPGIGVGLAIGRSDLNLSPPSVQESTCPEFLKPQTAYAQSKEPDDREACYRGAYAQCMLRGALTAPPTLTRERVLQNRLFLTSAVYRSDVYSKEVDGWSYAGLAEQ